MEKIDKKTKKTKNKALVIFSIISFIIGFLLLAFGLLVCFSDIGEEAISNVANNIEANSNEFPNLINSIKGANEELANKDIAVNLSKIITIILGSIYIIQGLAFILEGFLLIRAARNGKKSVLLIIILLISIISDIATLIGFATQGNYDFNSFIDVITVCINAYVLNKVFEARRIERD